MPTILMTTPIFPPDVGGPATYVPKLANHLVEHGWDVIVYALSSEIIASYEQYKFKLIRRKRDINPFFQKIRSVYEIYKIARSVDLVYANGLALETAIATKFAGKKMIQKFVGDVVWEHAHLSGEVRDSFVEFLEKKYSFKIELKKKVRDWWLNQGEFVIVPSCFLATILDKYCKVSKNKISVIYNGVTFPQLEHSIEKGDVFTVCTASRLIPLKCIDEIIDACASVENCYLNIIGDGPELDRLEVLAKEKMLGRVHFLGALPRAEVLLQMAQSNVFILNSVHEGLPHVAIEAMRMGVPVIATSVGGTPEVVQDNKNGFLIPPHSPNIIAQYIKLLKKDTEMYARLSEGAVETAGRFTDKKMFEQTDILLDKIINKK